MAYTCSYKKPDSEIVRNTMCFATFRRSYKNSYVIIEKNKFYFTLKQIRTYLNDLKQMGFNFTYRYNKTTEEFYINVTNGRSSQEVITLCMALRYLWEGTPKVEGSVYSSDKFYKVVEHYFKLKELYPKESKLKLLCYACNCFIIGKNGFNSNHFFSYSAGCKLKTILSEQIQGDINAFFTYSYKFNTLNYNYKKDPKEWTDEEYITFINYLNEKYKE